jgi:ABC-type proline/glycine betaine transport system ATPase subunit
MNLLGLFMKAALEARPEKLDRARVAGDIAMTAGRMSVTLCFSDDAVTVRKGVVGSPRAKLTRSLEALVQVARGSATPILTRKAKLSGNPLAAVPLAGVFRGEPR